MTPKQAYDRQKSMAKVRCIPWQFTFEFWLAVWEASGHLAQRGCGIDQYVMARLGDQGPYSPGNVEIILCQQNHRDMWKNHSFSFSDRSARNIGRGRGWTLRGAAYQVTVAKKYIGSFGDQQAAEAAYQTAVAARSRLLASNPATPETSGDRG